MMQNRTAYKTIYELPSSNLKKAFRISCLLHIGIMLFFILLHKLMGVFQTKNPEIKFIQSAVRVDVVGMPKYTLKELKEFEDKGEDGLTTGGKEESTIPEKSENSFLKLINKFNKKPIEGTKRDKNRPRGDLGKLIARGNKLQKGSSLTEGNGEGVTGILGEYASGLPDHVRNFWKLPSYLQSKNLRCRIRIFINASGELIKHEVFESSGDIEYDKRAIHAVTAASPFPPVPEEIRSSVARGELVLGFPL